MSAFEQLKRWGSRSSRRDSTASASSRLQTKLHVTKTLLLRKIGSASFEAEAQPSDYEDFKAHLKCLASVFEELGKTVAAIKSAVDQQASSYKQLSVALSGLAAPLSQTNSTAPLGAMLLEYCKAQHEVERLRDTLVCPVCETSKMKADDYLVKIHEAKRLCEKAAKALVELEAAHVTLEQLRPSEGPRQRLYSVGDPDAGDVPHGSLLQAYKRFYQMRQKHSKTVAKAMLAMQKVVLLSDFAALDFMESLFDAQSQFYGSGNARFQVLESRFRIKELFDQAHLVSDGIQEDLEKANLESEEKKDFRKWDPLVNFLAKCAEAVLVITPEQKDERELVNCIVIILDAYDLCYPILKDLITKEVEGTSDPSTLMRGNVYITKLLLSYMRMVCCGDAGLMLPLTTVIERALEDPEQYEVDPKKQNSERDNTANVSALENLVREFLDCIIDSLSVMPFALHNILAHLRAMTERKFPGKGKSFSGAFMFLRLVCPILVFPEQNNILPAGTEISSEGRRSLMLVSKVLQNLANGVKLREEYLVSMNESFFEEKMPVITQFFDTISQIPKDRSRCRAKLADQSDVKKKELPHLFDLIFKDMEKVANQLAYKGFKEQIGELARVMAGLSLSYSDKQ